MTERLAERIRSAEWIRRSGTVSRISALAMEARGPSARLGELCEVRASAHAPTRLAEVVGISESRVLLMPYGELAGCAVGAEVVATGRHAQAPVGFPLLGQVLDAFGQPLDGSVPVATHERYPLSPTPINPLERGAVREPLDTGIRAIDALLPLGRGQRMGIFAGSGVGKSTLLSMLTRYLRADVTVVALVGERGREVKAFVDHALTGPERAQTVVVAATSDLPPLVRRRAAFYATAVAEYFRDQGLHVALLMDSVTRVATAQREIGLAAGELPTARGYTPSVFSLLPRLLERGGVRAAGGSLTALYTILVDGDDMNDPLADAVRSILDGHIVLARDIAHRGRFPAIDVLQSVSRLAPTLCGPAQLRLVAEVVKALAAYEAVRDLIEVGAYRPGNQPATDRAIRLYPLIEAWLAQPADERVGRAESAQQLRRLLAADGLPA